MDKKNIITNTMVNIILQLMNVIIGLVIPKLILEVYGSEMNGLVSSINQVMIYLTLVESGLTQIAVVSLYKPLVEKDRNCVKDRLGAIKNFYNKTAYSYIVLLALLSIGYPLIVRQPYEAGFVIKLILILGIHYFIDFIFLGKYKVLLVADQKQYIISAVQIVTNIIYFLAEIYLLNKHVSIIWVKAIIPFVHIIRAIIIRIYINYKYNYIDLRGVRTGEKVTGRGSAVLHQITGLIMSSTDITLLTLLGVGLKEVSVYSVYNIVIAELNGLISAITNAIAPSFGKALVENKGNIKEQFSKFSGLLYYISFISFGPLALLYTGFIMLYTANVHDVNYNREELALLFSICYVLNSIKTAYIMLIQSSGKYKETQKDTVIEAIINIATTIPLIFLWGINGALVGTILAHLYRYSELLLFGKKYFSISPMSSLKKIIPYLFVNIALTVIIKSVWMGNYTFSNWASWIKIGAMTTILYITMNTIVFYIIDRKNLRYYFDLAIKKGKHYGQAKDDNKSV